MIDLMKERPIGVFDSGVGGISVLGRIVKDLPGETFIYLADNANAPYGTKHYDDVLQLSVNVVHKLLDMNIKALVVACNTATSVAINTIRGMTAIPVIGMEPAVKPAVRMCSNGMVAVMATPLTLKEEKFNNLLRKFDTDTTIIPVPCPGLVELIETEAPAGVIIEYLKKLFRQVPAGDISTIVLGCTHYSFIKKEILAAAGGNICIVDGSEGTSRHLKNMLDVSDLRATGESREPGQQVQFFSTSTNPATMELLYRFFERTHKDKSD